MLPKNTTCTWTSDCSARFPGELIVNVWCFAMGNAVRYKWRIVDLLQGCDDSNIQALTLRMVVATQIFLEFSPRIPGEMIQFDLRIFFSKALVQPPTSQALQLSKYIQILGLQMARKTASKNPASNGIDFTQTVMSPSRILLDKWMQFCWIVTGWGIVNQVVKILCLDGGNSNIIYLLNFHPEPWGRLPTCLTNVYQMGWFNHQLVSACVCFLVPLSHLTFL